MASAGKEQQAFDVRRLREHMQQAAAGDAVAFAAENGGIAGERAGVTGNVGDARRAVFRIKRGTERLRPSARRIKQPVVRPTPAAQLFGGDGKKVGAREAAAVGKAVRGGICGGARHHLVHAFDAEHVCAAARQRQAEIAEAAEEIHDARTCFRPQGCQCKRYQAAVEGFVGLGEIVRRVREGEAVIGQLIGQRRRVRRDGDGSGTVLQADLPRLPVFLMPGSDGFLRGTFVHRIAQADAQHVHPVASAEVHAENSGAAREGGAQGADVGEAGGEGGGEGEAMRDGDDAIAGTGAVAEVFAVPSEAGAGAIVPVGPADGGENSLRTDAADARQLFQPDRFFETVLRGVAGVLQGAAAAGGIMWASGGDAVRRRAEDVDDFCGRVAFFAFENAGGNAFARQRAADEMGLAVVAGDAARFIIEAGDVEGEGAGHNRDGKRLAHYSTPLRQCFRWECPFCPAWRLSKPNAAEASYNLFASYCQVIPMINPDDNHKTASTRSVSLPAAPQSDRKLPEPNNTFSTDDGWFERFCAWADEFEISEKILPRDINVLLALQHLNINMADCNFTTLPPDIGKLSKLQILEICFNGLTALPAEIGQLSNLQTLNLWGNQLASLPAEIGKLGNLRILNLWDNELTALPLEIGQLHNLQILTLGLSTLGCGNPLATLPPEIGQLGALQELYLYFNCLTDLPEGIGQLANLRTLDLSDNRLTTLPLTIGHLANLRALNLSENRLSTLPLTIGQIDNLQELELNCNQLTALPSTIGRLTELKTLNLSYNRLNTLPQSVARLHQLETLCIGGNEFTALPQAICQMNSLIALDLFDNRLTDLPRELGQLDNLQMLSLTNNQLTTLPEYIGELRQLTFLDLCRNPLRSLPASLKRLYQERAGELTICLDDTFLLNV